MFVLFVDGVWYAELGTSGSFGRGNSTSTSEIASCILGGNEENPFKLEIFTLTVDKSTIFFALMLVPYFLK